MRDLPDQPFLDKQALVGGCVRLGLEIDAARLAAEVLALPHASWDVRGGKHRYPRQGVHMAAETIFLRGHTPAEGDLPIADRPVLDQLPYVRQLVERDIGTRPQRCMLARLPAGASVAPHVDRAPYFSKTLRVHVPVESNDRAWMICDALTYRMRPGEAWALNNVTLHAVWNAHPDHARTHLICDFLPDANLLALLARGERGLGRPMPEADAHFASLVQGQALEGG
jgi:Aspartyl/Asparaginyl beta-hydroxylase